MTRSASRFASVAFGSALLAGASGCGPGGRGTVTPAPSPVPIVVTSRMDGSVSIVERDSLQLLREIPSQRGASTWPMVSVADAVERAFYVGNHDGGLSKIPFAEGPIASLDVGGPVAGLALAGNVLAVTGVKDLTVRLVDVTAWKETGRVTLGSAADAPKRPPLTYGVASPHPVWLADGSAFVVQDNLHEELVLVGRDATVMARAAMRSPVHAVLVAKDGTLLALGEGTLDGTVPAHVAVLDPKTLAVTRTVDVPLANGEVPKLHHGAISPDGELVVVANMGPVAGPPGFSVAAIRWRTGEVAWSSVTVPSAGHVAFLGDKVLVLGHRAAEMKLLDAKTGEVSATWEVLGTPSFGHSLEASPSGDVLVLDGTLGRLLRFRNGEQVAESPRVGDGYAESSLPE